MREAVTTIQFSKNSVSLNATEEIRGFQLDKKTTRVSGFFIEMMSFIPYLPS